jgi:CO/xanthine dehydrogenase Mo-binding subunit
MSVPVLPLSLKNNPRLAQWVRFETDGTATVFSGKVELGQGIVTAIAQIAAEELELPLDKLAIVAGDTTRAPDEWYTAGSQSIEVGGAAMRLACAEVRHLFLEAAARRFEVGAAELRIRDGIIEVPGTDLRTSYWELAPEVSLARDATGSIAPRPVAQHRIVGQSTARRDIPRKLAGAAFVHDMELPGMLHARVVRPRAFGARLEALDESAVRALPGVTHVVRSGSFVAVVARREEQAVKAAEKATALARWREAPALPAQQEITAFLQSLPSSVTKVHERGAAPAAAARRFAASYSKPYIAHASIGPSCALAAFEEGRMRIWSHTQGPHHLRAQIATVLGLPTENVDVIHRDGAGCYGHNGADDVALDAALVARACGHPVRLQWSREEELAWSPCGSAMAVSIAAGIDAAGNITDWKHELWSHTHVKRPGMGSGVNLLAAWMMEPPLPVPPPRDMPLPAGGGDRNAVPLYDFGHDEVHNHFIAEMPLRVSALRTLGAYANVFAIESMLDEIARAIGADPVAYRLRHLKDVRGRAVIEAAARASSWGQPLGRNRGRGIGFARYKNLSAYCAVVAEIEVAEKIELKRMFAAVDAGQVVNPDGLINQIEGGIVQAASWTLLEEMRWEREGLLTRSWEEYPILGFAEIPQVEVLLLNQPDLPGLGTGECAAGPTAAAIANALHDALGVRARNLPLTAEQIAKAI